MNIYKVEVEVWAMRPIVRHIQAESFGELIGALGNDVLAKGCDRLTVTSLGALEVLDG